MSSIPATQPNGQSQTGASSGGLANVDIDEFLNLLLTELQNQDPLDPLDNSEMAQQISQIREIAATDKLSATLNTVLTGQSLATASNLIGREVEALTPKGETVRGEVDKVTVEVDKEKDSRTYKIHIGDQSFALENVREVANAEE